MAITEVTIDYARQAIRAARQVRRLRTEAKRTTSWHRRETLTIQADLLAIRFHIHEATA